MTDNKELYVLSGDTLRNCAYLIELGLRQGAYSGLYLSWSKSIPGKLREYAKEIDAYFETADDSN